MSFPAPHEIVRKPANAMLASRCPEGVLRHQGSPPHELKVPPINQSGSNANSHATLVANDEVPSRPRATRRSPRYPTDGQETMEHYPYPTIERVLSALPGHSESTLSLVMGSESTATDSHTLGRLSDGDVDLEMQGLGDAAVPRRSNWMAIRDNQTVTLIAGCAAFAAVATIVGNRLTGAQN